MVNLQPLPPSSGNIFTNPATGGKSVMEKRIKYIHDRNVKSAYTFLIIASIILATYSYYFFYPELMKYLQAPAQIASLESVIAEYEEVTLPSLKNERDLHKAAYEKQYTEVIQALDKVFPVGINKYNIVKTFEDFSDKVSLLHPPFSFNSISLGKSVHSKDYVVTPISLSLNSSTAGFEKFLDLVHYSGYMDQAEKVRLMSISNIRVRYNGVDGDTGKDKGVNFSVKLNIYSRPVPKK